MEQYYARNFRSPPEWHRPLAPASCRSPSDRVFSPIANDRLLPRRATNSAPSSPIAPARGEEGGKEYRGCLGRTESTPSTRAELYRAVWLDRPRRTVDIRNIRYQRSA